MRIPEDMLQRAKTYVDRKYVSRADRRQKAMGLAYVTAERDDLAREMARFAMMEIERERAPTTDRGTSRRT